MRQNKFVWEGKLFWQGDGFYGAAHFSQFFDDSTIIMIAPGIGVKIARENEIQFRI